MTTNNTTKRHIQEHFQQIIWYSLDNNLVNNALFVAERLLSLNDRDQNSRHLLGLCMLRAGRVSSAYNITIHYRHLGCSYVFAQSCKELGKYREGLLALQNCLTQLPNKWTAYDHSSSTRNNLPDIGAVLCLMGHMQRASGDSKRATDTYIEALRANPYLWEAFDGLIELGVSLRVENCFKASSTMRALRESTHTTNIDSTVPPPNGFSFSSAEIPGPSRTTSNSTFQPIFNWSKSQPTFSGRFTHPFTPGTPTIQGISSASQLSEESPIVSTTSEMMKPIQRPPSRSAVDILKGKTGLRSVHETVQKKAVSSSSGAQNTRRSERLLSTNTRNYGKATSTSQGSKRNTRVVNSDNPKKNTSLESSQPLEEERNSVDAIPNMSFEERDEAESQLLGLYTKIGEGCYALSRYDCVRALAMFKSLPTSQSNTPYVLSRTARALYESRNLSEAYKEFVLLRQVDPGRLEDMELFSTVLFHLSKEVDLAFLAHEMVDLDWLAPQTWCVVGNSFASQHEHDQAIACFQRAVQLDPRFAYAYSLQGLEHTENEEYDKARHCFMNALRANKRLYHAWYGLGSVEFKSGKNQAATKCFKAASNLNPSNSIIMCCIGNCLERAGDFHGAMEEYKRAADITPSNISARYRLACMYIHLKHFDAAERELVRLKDASPDNAKPYFLLGRIYKAKGERAKALHNFTTALSLDPKASHIIKDQIENLDQPAEELYGGEGEVYKMDQDDV